MDESGAESTEELHFFYDAQSRPAFVEYNGVKYRYVHNLQGDVVGIVDSADNLVVEYRYDAWGKLLSTTGSLADTLGRRNPFRYRGYVYDEESGLYYLRSRYYNPAVGRFANADSYCGYAGHLFSHSLYTYCKNCPILLNDMDGHMAITATAAVAASSGPLGWIVGGCIIIGAILIASAAKRNTTADTYTYSYTSSMSSTQTKKLSDTKAKATQEAVYYLAYVSEQGGLVKVGDGMTMQNALIALGFAGATNALNQSFEYARDKSSDAQRTLEHMGSGNWGIYTHDQAHAKALASVVGAYQPPEVHGSGMYGHYHDATHTFHIWYGGTITY